MGLARMEVVADTLDAHIAQYFNTDVATDKLSKRLLTSSAFMAQIATCLRHIMDTAMEDKKYSVS